MAPDRPELILLLHGIRTRAHWQTLVRDLIRNECKVDVRTIGYGRFDLFRFLLPGWTRNEPVERITREFRSILDDHRETGVDISVVAHSFGTYVIAKMLSRNPDISIKSLIFCGSVVSEQFDWFRIKKQIGLFLNECGTRDIWPVFAKSVTWGYGPTGTFGFKAKLAEDRVHPFKHSDYFDETFVRDFWIPVFNSNYIKPAVYDQAKLKNPFVVSLIDLFSIKWLYLIGFIALAFFLLFPQIERYIDSGPAANSKGSIEQRLTRRQLKDIQLNLCVHPSGDFGDDSSPTRRAITHYQVIRRYKKTGELGIQERTDLEYPISECENSDVSHKNAFEKFSYPARADIEKFHKLAVSVINALEASKAKDGLIGMIETGSFVHLSSFGDQTRQVISQLQSIYGFPPTGELTPDFDARLRQATSDRPPDVQPATTQKLAWGRKVSDDFRKKVVEICTDLRCDPNHLMALMAFETGEGFSPSVRNPASRTVGLLQFLQSTAAGMGTSLDALAAMSAVEQLDYVKKYLQRFSGRISTLSDIVAALHFPIAVGQPDSYVMYTAPSEFDINRDGAVTKGEIAKRVMRSLERGMLPDNYG